jgi:hypothetical protein
VKYLDLEKKVRSGYLEEMPVKSLPALFSASFSEYPAIFLAT